MLSIVAAKETDLLAIADLFEEMDRFYGATDFVPVGQRVAQIKDAILRDPPAANVLLASENDVVVGIATYSYLWPAIGLTSSLFLKELYVLRAHRRTGVGRQLMQRILEVATEAGCSRVEWMTDRRNREARQFYESLGYRENDEKVFYRVQG